MKKIYIGSKFCNAHLVLKTTDILREYSYENIYNWALITPNKETKKEKISSALKEIDAIKKADAILFFMPLGKGSLIELGVALSNQKPIFLCSFDEKELQDITTNFFELSNIQKIVGTYDKIIEILIQKLEKI